MNEEVYTSFQWLNKPRGEGMRKELTRTITAPARPRRTASEAAWMKATLCTRTGRPGRPVSKTFQRQESEKKLANGFYLNILKLSNLETFEV